MQESYCKLCEPNISNRESQNNSPDHTKNKFKIGINNI